ncbi:MAG TPA: hypothetical protein VHG35_08660 [Gemmatimonadales bacterium]|nr:hypothetical protein [Gemmatimonadales bacterium]
MDGIYQVDYAGAAGTGMALLVFLNGVISGATVGGAVLDGTYSATGGGTISCQVTMRVPAGLSLVTGTPPSSQPTNYPFGMNLPQQFDGHVAIATFQFGSLELAFKKLRDL